jgi:acetoin utilization deacetylase AcuC-like enzyme
MISGGSAKICSSTTVLKWLAVNRSHPRVPLDIFTTDHCPLPLPPGHRFPGEKYSLLRKTIQAALPPNAALYRSIPATSDQLLLAHEANYLQRIESGELDRADILRLGLPWSQELVTRSKHSTGATLQAARAALRDGIGVHLAGGTHHAFANRAEGFCVFNDAVVASRTLQAEGRVKRVAIMDADVHQGNGTASITARDSSIFTFSIHGRKNFPFVKVPSDLDLALPDRTGDMLFLQAWKHGVTRAFQLSKPDIVFYLAGADPHEGDRFSRWLVTKEGLAARDRLILQECLARSVPVVVTMAGGYGKNIQDTVDIHANTVQIAAHLALDA